MKKRKINYSNVIITGLIALLVILVIVAGIMVYGIIKETFGKGSKKEVEVVDNIEKYGYQLTENNTDYYKKLYYELKEVLNDETSETFDEEYASLVARLFVADFYDLNSKLNKTDIGGVQFVYTNYQETFKNFASDVTGIYYYVENNIYGDREQKLPIVKEVTVTEITNINYVYNDINDSNAYQVKLYIDYEEDFEYPKHATVVLIHSNNKIEVVKMN